MSGRGIGQSELANELQVTQQAISKWLRDKGQPSALLVDRLCNHLSINREWLLSGTGKRPYLTQLLAMGWKNYELPKKRELIDKLRTQLTVSPERRKNTLSQIESLKTEIKQIEERIKQCMKSAVIAQDVSFPYTKKPRGVSAAMEKSRFYRNALCALLDLPDAATDEQIEKAYTQRQQTRAAGEAAAIVHRKLEKQRKAGPKDS